MGKLNFATFIKNTQAALSKYSPQILTGIGIAGMLTTTVLAVKATPKALELIEEKKKEEKTDKLPPLEVVKTTWKCYIPAAVLGATSTACLIGANSVHVKRGAALATAYKLSETALQEYREKVVETIGEKKEQAIRDKLDEEHVKAMPVSKSEIIVTSKGNTLCLDYHSGRYFYSDIDKIKKAINELNHLMLVNEYVSLNDFYDEIGLDHTRLGDEMGWAIGKDGLIDVNFGSQITDDGTPCIVVNYSVAPRYDYSRLS